MKGRTATMNKLLCALCEKEHSPVLRYRNLRFIEQLVLLHRLDHHNPVSLSGSGQFHLPSRLDRPRLFPMTVGDVDPSSSPLT